MSTVTGARVYLDYHATTPVDPRVVDVVARHMRETVGNPSSSDHTFGDEAAAVIDTAAAEVAALVGACSEDVVFTAGATEALNLALQGFARAASRRLGRLPRVVVSAIEHHAVLATAKALADDGLIALSILPVDGAARIDLEALERTLRERTDLVAVMAANHEVGTIQPVAEVGRLTTEAGAALLCDATQAVGKVALDMSANAITYLTLSAHKFYGPKGIGALVTGAGAPLAQVFFGGTQQHGRRPGTVNVPGVAGLGEACRLRRLEMAVDEPRIADLRDRLEHALRARVPNLVVNGDRKHRLAGNLHVSLPDVPNQAVIARVRQRLAISTGAACTSGIEAPSHVLQAMRLPQVLQDGALRIGLGKFTTEAEVDAASREIVAAATAVREALASA